MKVLVIGTGGREHALAWKLAQSPQVTGVFAAPGSMAMTDCASVIPLQGSKDYVRLAKDMGIDLTVAGPETVLVDGLADRFKEAGLAFFGPSGAAARIEGSKKFAKDLMKKYHMPLPMQKSRIIRWLSRRMGSLPARGLLLRQLLKKPARPFMT